MSRARGRYAGSGKTEHLRPANEDDDDRSWDPEEVTEADNNADEVRALFDPDERTMLGKLARHQVRTQRQVTELSRKVSDWIEEWREERQEARAARRRQTKVVAGGAVGFVGLLEVVLQVLKQTGVIK